MELVEFLLARIAEDEQVLNASRQMGVPPLSASSRMWSGIGNHATVSETRLAAECEAKRNVATSYQVGREAAKLLARQGRTGEAETARNMYAGIELALSYLALPYADHPDYDEAWRP